MPSTLKHAISYPAGTAAPNVPLVMQTTAESVEAALEDIPQGIIAYAKTTSNSGAVGTTISVVNNIGTVPFVNGRRYRISWISNFYTSNTTTTAAFKIHTAATTDGASLTTGLTTLADTEERPVTANERYPLNFVTYYDSTAGAKQLKVTVNAVSGAGTVVVAAAATSPGFLIVEDMGAF